MSSSVEFGSFMDATDAPHSLHTYPQVVRPVNVTAGHICRPDPAPDSTAASPTECRPSGLFAVHGVVGAEVLVGVSSKKVEKRSPSGNDAGVGYPAPQRRTAQCRVQGDSVLPPRSTLLKRPLMPQTVRSWPMRGLLARHEPRPSFWSGLVACVRCCLR